MSQGGILIVDDDPALLQALPEALRLRMAGVTVDTAESAFAALDRIAARDYDAIVTDIKMPGMDGLELLAEIRARRPGTPTLVITGHGENELVVRALRGGASDFIHKPIDRDYFVSSLRRAIEAREAGRREVREQLALERHVTELEDLAEERSRRLRQAGRAADDPLCLLMGSSGEMAEVVRQIGQVAASPLTVLVEGETGTGKELIARAIHNLSARRDRTLVKVNCAAIPTGLLESELFGHEKGAFTGAIAQRLGRFELAHRGTLFLDEVGDIPLELQPKLLRVLQEQEFERLGSARTTRVDVRLVAATNADLAKKVADHQFRSDLYYRLNVFPVVIPPLRERREDIPVLVRYFAQKYARRMKKSIDSVPVKAMSALTEYHWPGNVRELENFIERAVILSRGSQLEIPLSEFKQQPKATLADVRSSLSAADRSNSASTLEEAEREHILRALSETNWVIGGNLGAAARLGMKRTTLQSLMRRLGIARPS
jgi:DNA-binding NtrC family response regulator